MVKNSKREGSLVAIPSVPVLQERLAHILAESKRLKLLIRTAKDLERLQSESVRTEDQTDG